MRHIIFSAALLAVAMLQASCRESKIDKTDKTKNASESGSRFSNADEMKAYLVGNKWGDEGQLYFTADNTIQWKWEIMGEHCRKGKYQIRDQTITFQNWTKCDPDADDTNLFRLKGATCEIKKTPDNPDHEEHIVCGKKGMFGNTGKKTTAGATKKIDGAKVVMMKGGGVTTANVKLRSGPSTNTEVLEFKSMDDDIMQSYIPKGFELEVVARTKDKYEVGKWNNHWYYVEPNMETGRGWVFGEFLDTAR